MGDLVSSGGGQFGETGFKAETAPETYDLFIGRGEPVEKLPGDIVFPIQEMVARVPEDPVLINGTPYAIKIDTQAVTTAVNRSHDPRYNSQPGRYNLRMLKIDLSDGLHPKIKADEEPDEKPVHDFRTNSLNLSVPSEITDSKLSEQEIADKTTAVLNRELSQGLIEVSKHKGLVTWSKVKTWGCIAVLAAAGEAIGAESSPHNAELLYKASGGALIGAAIGVLIFSTKRIIDVNFRKRPNIRDEVAAKKAFEAAKKEVSGDIPEWRKEYDFSENPAITLERVAE